MPTHPPPGWVLHRRDCHAHAPHAPARPLPPPPHSQIGFFTGAIAQLTLAICGNPAEGKGGKYADSWYCSDDPWAAFCRNTFTSLAPSILLSLYHM